MCIRDSLLPVRLAADTGARRGELAALRFDDLAGRSLTIARAVSAGQLTVPKSRRSRTLTVGTSTAVWWHTLAGRWAERATHAGRGPLGSWLFASDPGQSPIRGPSALCSPPAPTAHGRGTQLRSPRTGRAHMTLRNMPGSPRPSGPTLTFSTLRGGTRSAKLRLTNPPGQWGTCLGVTEPAWARHPAYTGVDLLLCR